MYDTSRILELLEREKLDAIAGCTKENVRYLAGFEPVLKTLTPYHGVCWAVVTRDAPDTVHIVHSFGEADQILDMDRPLGECSLHGTFYREPGTIRPKSDDDRKLELLMRSGPLGATAFQAIHRLIAKLGLMNGRVAVDENGVRPELIDELRSNLATINWTFGSELLGELRQIKTSQEVELLQSSVATLESGIHAAASSLEIGVSECEIARTFELEVVRSGGRPALTLIKIGPEAVAGQRRQSSSVRACQGDVVWFDCDIVKAGYWADVARVFVMGEDHRFRDKFEALLQGQRRSKELIRPGMTGADVFHQTMAEVHRAGFPEYRRHHVGHGIGLEPYERPILAPGSTDVIKAGMVLSVETPYYEFGLGALHIEDPIQVGEHSNASLSSLAAELLTVSVTDLAIGGKR